MEIRLNLGGPAEVTIHGDLGSYKEYEMELVKQRLPKDYIQFFYRKMLNKWLKGVSDVRFKEVEEDNTIIISFDWLKASTKTDETRDGSPVWMLQYREFNGPDVRTAIAKLGPRPPKLGEVMVFLPPGTRRVEAVPPMDWENPGKTELVWSNTNYVPKVTYTIVDWEKASGTTIEQTSQKIGEIRLLLEENRGIIEEKNMEEALEKLDQAESELVLAKERFRSGEHRQSIVHSSRALQLVEQAENILDVSLIVERIREKIGEVSDGIKELEQKIGELEKAGVDVGETRAMIQEIKKRSAKVAQLAELGKYEEALLVLEQMLEATKVVEEKLEETVGTGETVETPREKPPEEEILEAEGKPYLKYVLAVILVLLLVLLLYVKRRRLSKLG